MRLGIHGIIGASSSACLLDLVVDLQETEGDNMGVEDYEARVVVIGQLSSASLLDPGCVICLLVGPDL